jgi:hypothetical protein
MSSELWELFENSADVELIKQQRIGPDEIVIQLEGNTLQSKIAHSIDFCKRYEAIFQVPLGGRYFLKVIRLRTNYSAIRYDDEFPPMHYEAILDEELGKL